MNQDLSKEKIPPLKCIFFAEFDKDKGRKLCLQIPNEIISTSRFDQWDAFVLPKKEMLDKLVKYNLPDLKIMGYPIGLEGSHYPRNAYYFNLCFVTDNISHVDCLYEPLVQKMARYLSTLERESGFLHNPETRDTLPELLLRVFNGLNEYGRCSIVVNDKATINLQLSSHSRDPPSRIPLHHVPVYLKGKPSVDDCLHLDVLFRKIAPWIDGAKSIHQIGGLTRIDPTLVAKCIQNLLFYNYVALIPPFEYRNVYVATPELHKLFSDQAQQQEWLSQCALDAPGVPSPTFPAVFRLLASLQRGINMKQWTLRWHPREYGVHERKLVQYGLLKGVVQKLWGYPVFVGKDTESRSQLEFLCDGRNTLEDIAIILRIYPAELEQEIFNSDRVSIIWK